MSIVSFNTQTPGLVGVYPRTVQLVDTYNLATITAAGYLNRQGQVLQGISLLPTDVIHVIYSYVASTNSGTFGIFTPSISAGVITLVQWANPGDVLLPVVSGDLAVFNGTTGQIKDTSISSVNPTFTGNLQAATLTSLGAITGGSAGAPGNLQLFPTTASKGYLYIVPANNAANYQVEITNASFGQASTITLPDPGGASANLVLDHGTTTMNAAAKIILGKANGTEAANAVTASAQSGVITTSALTTAGAGSYAITWTNTFIASTSVILLTIMGGTNTTENITLKATAGSGTSTLTIYNNTAATALNGTILIGYLVV